MSLEGEKGNPNPVPLFALVRNVAPRLTEDSAGALCDQPRARLREPSDARTPGAMGKVLDRPACEEHNAQ